jgi:hypothetical protein
MSDDRFLRKANTGPFLDEEDSPLLLLLRDMFIENGAEYCVKELAADLGVSVYSVYKKFGGDQPLRASTLIRIIGFVNFKNPDDMRLIDFINAHAGCTAMPNREGIDHVAARRVVLAAYEAIKGK